MAHDDWLTVLEFNDTSIFVGHFVSSPREWEKRDSRGDEREGQGRKKEEQEWKWRNRRNKNISPLPLPATRIANLAQLEANISWTPQWHKLPSTFATPNQLVMRHLIRIYTVCHSVLHWNPYLRPWTCLNSKMKEPSRNSGMKGLFWYFTSLPTLFKSYQDDGRMIMKGSVQWSAVQSHGTQTHDLVIRSQKHKPLGHRDTSIKGSEY